MVRARLWHTVGIGIIALVLYLITGAPGLTYTDSGELSAAASVWGVAHPTGYPLFTLIAHVWTLLPWNSVVGGLNILAAVIMASVAAALVPLMNQVLARTHSSLNATSRLIVADVTALLLATSATIWAQAVSIEVYALNALLLLLTLNSLVGPSDSAKRTVAAGFFFGLMLANHLSAVFLAPGLLLMWWMGMESRQSAKKRLPWLLLPALLGPLLYGLLPLRSAARPPINWGFVDRGWDAFLYHVKGTQFSSWIFSDSGAVSDNADTFLSLASAELLWGGWILAIIGLVICYRRWRSLALGLGVLMAGNLAISLGYAIPDIDSYFIPSFIALAVFFGLGLASAAQKIPRNAIAVLFVIPVASTALVYPDLDHSSHRAVPAYTEWAMANVEPNAIVITRQWDYLCSAFWYMQTVEGFRTDVAMIDKELLRRTWYAPYLTQRYPDVMKGAKTAVDAYMPWLMRFEKDADAFNANPRNGGEIQRLFVAMLNAVLDGNPDRPLYVTPELIRDEAGFAEGYTAHAAGPLVRLVRDANFQSHTSTEHVEEIITSLAGRTSRLDEGLRAVVLNALDFDARYAEQMELRTENSELRALRSKF